MAKQQRTWQQQYDYCRANNGGMDLVSLESNPEEKAIHAAWTTSEPGIIADILAFFTVQIFDYLLLYQY